MPPDPEVLNLPTDFEHLANLIRERGGRITVRELQRANNRRWPDSISARASLEALVDAGKATWVLEPGGRQSKTVQLTADVDDDGPDDVSVLAEPASAPMLVESPLPADSALSPVMNPPPTDQLSDAAEIAAEPDLEESTIRDRLAKIPSLASLLDLFGSPNEKERRLAREEWGRRMTEPAPRMVRSRRPSRHA